MHRRSVGLLRAGRATVALWRCREACITSVELSTEQDRADFVASASQRILRPTPVLNASILSGGWWEANDTLCGSIAGTNSLTRDTSVISRRLFGKRPCAL